MQVHPGDPVIVDRYTAGARINHWITAVCLVLLALSGLALFHPSLFFLTALFGGGQTTRASIPGSASCCSSASSGCSSASGRPICGSAEDGTWLAHLSDVLTAHEEKLPEIGKYNAGQKVVFWVMSILIIVLILSGLVIWDQYFALYTTHRAEAVRGARSRYCSGRHHLRLDRPCLCGDLGAWYDRAP